MEPLVAALIDYGIAGLFLIYMIWTKTKDQARAEAQQKRYEERLDSLRSSSKVEADTIRDRYRQVVEKYDSQIKTYSEERQQQIQVYAQEREDARTNNTSLKSELDLTLKDIKREVAENGVAIARLQTQMESWNVRIAR